MKTITIPRIGAEHEGGIFTGIGRGTDADHQLITGPLIEAENWDAYMAKIKACNAGGFTDWEAPTRKDHHLQMANIPEHFDWGIYDTGEEAAGRPDDAWYTVFSHGDQRVSSKNGPCRGRPVRKSKI